MPEAETETETASHVGIPIRQLRMLLGLSLSELASRAGVGKATLSGIEDGTRSNPTIETLYALCGQLGVPVAVVLARPTVPVHEIASEAEMSMVLLETFTDCHAVTEIYRLCVRPGKTRTAPPRPSGTVEYVTVFSGILRVGLVGAPVLVSPGGHAAWPADVPRVYTVAGGEEVHASLVVRTDCS